MKILNFFLVLFLANSLIFQTILGSEWKLEKEAEGIAIYTRNIDGSSIKEFKAEMTITCNIADVLRILQDVNNYKNWMPDCIDSKLLKLMNENEQYYYIENKLPFPFENRDMILKAEISNKEGIQTISLNAIPDYIQKIKKKTRIKVVKGKWELIPEKDGKVLIRHQLLVEPGGNLPAWLVNLKIIEQPFSTFKNLKTQLSK